MLLKSVGLLRVFIYIQFIDMLYLYIYLNVCVVVCVCVTLLEIGRIALHMFLYQVLSTAQPMQWS